VEGASPLTITKATRPSCASCHRYESEVPADADVISPPGTTCGHLRVVRSHAYRVVSKRSPTKGEPNTTA